MYQALYRKYRPLNFRQVLGQDHITITLENQIQNGNISHAYLFSGTRGTGKTSTAKIFSRAVNCLNPDNGNPCNQCEICKAILNESIMDILEMDAASNNSVEDIRELREKVVYPPSKAKYKVYIIDEVHMLSRSAFNALLKTLEEPPKHLIFILATTEPEKLPQTILSRCQRFDFKRVAVKDIISNMEEITSKMGMEVDEKVFGLIARNADGAMRDALSLLDKCLSFGDGKLEYEDAINILGITNTDLIFDLVDNLIAKNLEFVLKEIDKIIQDGKDISQFIKDIIGHYRNLMLVKTSKDPGELIATDQVTMEKYQDQVKDLDLKFILNTLEILNNAEEKAKYSTQPRIMLEMAAIQITKLDERFSLEERLKRLEMGMKATDQVTERQDPRVQTMTHEKVKEDTSPRNQEVKKVEVKKETKIVKEFKEDKKVASSPQGIPPSGGSLDITKIKNNWDAVLNVIKGQQMRLYALIIEGAPVRYENNLLTIGYNEPYGFHKQAVNSPQNKEFVEKILKDYFKEDIEIKLVMGGLKVNSEEEEKKKKDKAIKEVVDFFGEDIVEIK